MSTTQSTRADYTQSDWYDAESLDGLKRRLDALSGDDDTLRSQAEAEYRPEYETQKNALRDTLERETASAQSERDALAQTYDKRRRLTNESYDRSAASLNNTLNARGLGRSSLTGTENASLERERNRALDDISAEEATSVNAINKRIAQLTEDAARDEQTLSSNYADKLASRVASLKSANQTAAISLQLQIAALQQQGYEAYRNALIKERAQQLDEDEFREKYGLNDTAPSKSTTSSGKATATSTASPAQSSTSSSGNALKSLGETLKSLLSGKISKTGGSGGVSSSSYRTGVRKKAIE